MAAAIFLFLLHLSVFISTGVVTAQQRNSTISLGSSLSPTSNTTSWLSSSGQFAFGFYQEGNSFAVGIWLPGIPQKTVVWTANQDNPQVSSNVTLLLTSDGLILRPAQGQDQPITDHPEPASSASMLDTGNFVLYNSNLKIIWQSFDSPTNTILQGQRLMAGEELFSSVSETDHSKGRFRLKMQHDGNLVQYPIQTPDTAAYAYYASGTQSAGDNVTVNLDDDGQLYLLNSTGFNIRDIMSRSNSRPPNNGTIFYRMTIDVDGIFRLYSHTLDRNGNWSIRGESSTNRCAPKGVCGVNAYCTLNDQDPDCRCLPGFRFINQGVTTQGCERENNVENCGTKKGPFKYSMSTLENTEWEDDPYSIVTSNTKDECGDVCLTDCNCEAVMFENQLCRKQKLPLRYGKRTLGSTRTAFIKVGAPPNNNDTTEIAKGNKERKKNLPMYFLVAGVSFVACAVIFLGISCILFSRYGALAYQKISDQRNIGLTEEMSLQSFTYDELEKATNGFKEVVGRGSFGTVFKGTLSNRQRLIAVKKLEKLVDGEREFLTEMRAIGRTHHRNLVQLLGYCHEGSNRLLVYEFMSNGSLADFLFKAKQRPGWNERVETALNIARGILYLHEECETQIIHCDIKPQNILMDEYGFAKIADFGLAKLLKPNQTKTFTGIRGTRGYVAPEWHRNLPITVKADVYSFGIVLLEIICCRKSLDMELVEEEVVLVDWVCQCFDDGELGKLVTDEDQVDMKRFERMVRVALWCIQDEPSLRPSMKKVVLMLEGTIEIPTPPSPTSFLSCI